MNKIKYFITILVIGILSFSMVGLSAGSYPERNITCFIGFSAGGPTDLIGRGFIPILQEILGVGIGISNMPGASGATAAKHVMEQPADGYTIEFGSEAFSVWQVMDVINISPYEDFKWIKLVVEARPTLAVPPDSKFNTAEEFIKYAQEHPGELRIGTAGPATVPHVCGLILQKHLGCEFTFVPYQGGGPAITAVMGGQVDATIEMVQAMVSGHQAGQLKILASFTNEPIPGLEEIPPIGQIFPELQSDLPYGPYFGPCVSINTPDEVVKVLEDACAKVVQDQRWIDYTDKFYLNRIDFSGEEAVEYLKDWTAMASWLLYNSGVAPKSPTEFGMKNP